jgi:hypothetical protein
LDALLQRLLAKRPEDRPATAADVALALVPFASKTPATAVVRKVTAPPDGSAVRQRVPIPADDLSSMEATRILDSSEAEREPPAPLTLQLRTRKPPPASRKARWWRIGAVVGVVVFFCAWLVLFRKPASPSLPHAPSVKEPIVDRLRDYVPAETGALLQVQPGPLLTAAVFRRDKKAARQPLPFDPGAGKLLDALGIDVERDVDQIRFCFPSGAAEQALWIVHGQLPTRFRKTSQLESLAAEPNGKPGLFCYRPAVGKPIYLGHHLRYLLASQQRQEVVNGLEQAKTGQTALPAEDMRRLLGRIDKDQHLWLAVACKQIGKVGRVTNEPLTDAGIQVFLKNASTIEVGLRCGGDLRLRVRFQANNDPSAKKIIETIKGLQGTAKLGLALTPKKEYERRLWLRLLMGVQVKRHGLWVDVESQVTPAMVG